MSKISRNELMKKLALGTLQELSAFRVEFKTKWDKDFGKDISAIANHIDRQGGWLLVGVEDDGKLSKRNSDWAKKEEAKISSHLTTFLNPDFTVVDITAEDIDDSSILIIEIRSPDDVVYWDSKAYKLLGTSSQEMQPSEILSLSIKLPGADYSKLEYQGEINNALVMEFAQKMEESEAFEGTDLRDLTSKDILLKLHILNRKASGILFGDIKVRVAHYDLNGDILDQKEEKGLYSVLKDDFIEAIQSWTRKEGTALHKHSISAIEESPYPIKALRDSLANAVGHALYSKNHGDIVVELHPDRLVISNNCSLEAKFFVNKWFSSASKSNNRLLMTALRIAKMTDELGSGKNRIFRYMIEAGKKEPIVEFTEYGGYGKWKITLYNNQDNANLIRLIDRLKEKFPNPSYWRLATALVLWRKRNIDEIKEALDEHHKHILQEILQSEDSPILFFSEKDTFILKRWAMVAIVDGQISKAFTEAEENNLREFLNYYSYRSNSEGNMSSLEARKLIGLSNAEVERAQLSRLFKKWQNDGVVEKIKKGEWRFIIKPQ